MLLEQSLALLELPAKIPPQTAERLVNETSAKSISDLYINNFR